MRLYSGMCGVSRAVIAQFQPHTFLALQQNNKSEFAIYKTVRNILKMKKQLSVTDWKTLNKVCSARSFGFQAYTGLVSTDPGLSEVRKLFSALEEENILTTILKGQILQVFKIYQNDCTEDDHKFILDTVDEISTKFPVLTPQIVRPLLSGVGITSKWKEKCEFLSSKLTTTDSSVYELTALAAFQHKDFSYAWDQLRKASTKSFGENWSTEVFHGIVESHKLCPNDGILSKLFDFIEEFSLVLPFSVAKEIDRILNKDMTKVSRMSFVGLSGHCDCCKAKLRKIALTGEERNNLLSCVEKRFEVDCKFATYEKKELQHFKMFLKLAPPYTVVVDGANLFFRSKSRDFLTAKKTLQALEERGHKVLLIGRNHMKKVKQFVSIFKNHQTYFVKDRSVDDAYVIYAAVHSGPNTEVVTNDYFGTYYAGMPQETRLVYKKWQLSHQVVCTGYLGSHLVFPEISPICQRSEDNTSLHIPIVPDVVARSAFAPSGWLCVQHVTEEQKKREHTLWPRREVKLDSKDSHYAFKGHVESIRENFSPNEKSVRKIQSVRI